LTENDDSIANENLVRSAYNKIAEQYDSDRAIFHNNFQLELFIKQLPEDSKVILDAGCGSGRIMNAIQRQEFEVVGIDFSKKMLGLSKENAPFSELLEMDLSTLAFKEGVFDGVVAMYSIIHLPRTKHGLLFQDFHRILRIGGCILISLGVDDLETVEEYKPYGVLNFWSNADPTLSLRRIKDLGFEIIFDEVLEQGGEKFYWVIGRKVSGFK
jgi:ubiquinone/menaquinone biosynthesis C-methylase UbiE